MRTPDYKTPDRRLETTLYYIMKNSERLKVALEIIQAAESGNPVEWEIQDLNGKWIIPDKSETINWCIFQEHPIRIKPWILGNTVNGFTLSEGQQWHRTDGWKQEWLPEGWRPALLGELLGPHQGEVFVPSGEWMTNPCTLRSTSHHAWTRTWKTRK
jgi:hypothetical protein